MIVITTPTGAIGHRVLDHVLGKAPVRVIARDRTKVHADVEVIEGSHGDATVCDQAFAGADTVFWLPPPDPRAASLDAAYVEFTRPACAAFVRHGVKRVVGISALGRTTALAHDAGYVTASLAIDDLIASTGVAYRALVMPSFMDNLLRQADGIKNRGVFVNVISPDRKAPLCAVRDIAAVAARLLLDDTWRGVEEVPVLGPEDLSHDDMARIMSEVLGRPVRYQQVAAAAMKAQALERGASEAMAQGRIAMMLAKENGLDNGVARTAANSTPTTFRQWCEENLA